MDYVEAFRNLKPKSKYNEKTQLKVALLLAVMDLYESNTLTNNEIYYDEVLSKAFSKVWKRVFPDEDVYRPEAYKPFWYLHSESFWHIVPKRGGEEILQILKDDAEKPYESVLKNCCKYAELDEDLYFLMTLPSGRTSLKKALLETYTSLSPYMILRLSQSKDNSVDNSVSAMSEFEKILSKPKKNTALYRVVNSESEQRFRALADDVQIALNIEYFTFLKRNPYDRDAFREICADVYQLHDRLTVKPVTSSDISPSFISTYRDFLYDLKISLMSENGALDLIGSIDEAMQTLDGAEPASSDSVGLYDFVDDHRAEVDSFVEELQEEIEEEATADIPESNELPELKPAIESRKGKRWDEEEEFTVKFYFERGYSFDVIASAMGRTETSIKAKLNSLGLIDYDWETDSIYTAAEPTPEVEEEETIIEEEEFNYVPKGKIVKIKDVAQNTYDLLFMIALVDLETVSNRRGSHTLDELACMMIAHAWELMNKNPEAKEKENDLRECIEFLIEESKEYMDVELSWESSKDDVFEAIRDYPMAGVFEDTVECLVYEAPYNVLRAWYPDDSNYEIQVNSQNFTKPCLYAFYNKKIDPFVTINGNWQGNIFYDHDQLLKYFKMEYNKFVELC